VQTLHGFINLIMGQNNTGKTALLEALSVLLAQPDPSACGNLPNEFRAGVGNADWQENFWDWLFYRKNLQLVIELKCDLGDGDIFGWRIHRHRPDTLNESNLHEWIQAGQVAGVPCYRIGKHPNAGRKAVNVSTRPSNPNQDAIDFNRVVVKRRKKDLVELLRPIEENLDTLETLQVGKQGQPQAPLIYADLGLPEMMPVAHLGQGFCRLLDIYSEILASDAQVLLVDEIENGIHLSAAQPQPTYLSLESASRRVGESANRRVGRPRLRVS
jgi:hypothetical protein